MGDSYIPYVLQMLATTQRGAGDGNPPWLPNFPAFSKAMEPNRQNWCKSSKPHPIAAASGHPPQLHLSPIRSKGRGGEESWAGWGDPGFSPGFATHASTLLSELHRPWCHLPWSRFLHLTVGQGNRAVKTLRKDWKRAVIILQSA